MSTKSSIVYEPDSFHLFTECLDDDFVYLVQEDVEFEVRPNEVMVAIPVEDIDRICAAWMKYTVKFPIYAWVVVDVGAADEDQAYKAAYGLVLDQKSGRIERGGRCKLMEPKVECKGK